MARAGGKEWLKKLFGSGSDDHAKEPVEERQEEATAPEKEQPVTSTQPCQSEEESLSLEIESGALLRVWQQWKGESSFPPPLPIDGGRKDMLLPLSGNQAIAREKLRLKAQLEKDARERIHTIESKGENADLDAECRVYLSRFGMVAWVFIFPPCGENGKMHIEDVGKALQASGVTSGIDSSVVLSLVQEHNFFTLIPIACGVAPVEGENGRIVEHYPREFRQEIKVDENGVADYRSLAYVQMIQKGDAICDIIPPVEGKPGLRVDGKIVETNRVRPAKIPAGSNTELSEDGKHLVASIDGHLVFSNDVFFVRPLLDIPGDVDYSTGNVDFRGDVHIHGDVRENFFVRATGTVSIDGTVEAANIEAGGDLLVSCGVLGDNRATIKSGGCVRVKYLESCVAYAAKGVYADCIMAAQVYSDDVISVTTGRGTIIGGNLTAARKVSANMIGSQAGMKTSIVLGVLPYYQEMLRNEMADLKTVRQEMEELNKTLDFLEEEQNMAGMDEKLAKARLRRSVLSMKENQLLRRQELNQPAELDISKCRLECDEIYPVTSLKIQDAVWKTEQVRKSCKLMYDEETGGIKEL